MNDTLRFEAEFDEGEPYERMACWKVIEWDEIRTDDKGKVVYKQGNRVWESFDLIGGEADAQFLAYRLNTEYYCGT